MTQSATDCLSRIPLISFSMLYATNAELEDNILYWWYFLAEKHDRRRYHLKENSSKKTFDGTWRAFLFLTPLVSYIEIVVFFHHFIRVFDRFQQIFISFFLNFYNTDLRLLFCSTLNKGGTYSSDHVRNNLNSMERIELYWVPSNSTSKIFKNH